MKQLKFFTMLLMLLPTLALTLVGCGGSSSTGSSSTADTGVNKSAVSGTVSFPALSSLVAKQVAATTVPSGTVIPPVLTITDLSGNAITPAPTLTPVSGSTKQFTYSINLPTGKDYILKATWGGQVLKALADATSLNETTLAMNINPVSTAEVMIIEQKLTITPGTLGTSAIASSTTLSGLIAALSPATLLQAVEASQSGTTTTYTALINAVTSSLTSATPVDPTTATSVVTEASSVATNYIPPATPNFTSANSTTFTVGSAGSFTVTGIGSFSVAGTLPAGVTFNQSTGVLSGTATAGTNGTYPLTITASNEGLTATQSFTLSVNAATVIATYSNASLSGVWMLTGSDTPIYMVSDGDGMLTDISLFNPAATPSTYTVNGDGTFTLTLKNRSMTFLLTGNLTSPTSGNVTTADGASTSGTLTKVVDLSKGQGNYIVDLIGGGAVSATYGVAFTVDSTGTIGSFRTDILGATTITNSKLFVLADGTTAFMIRTNATSDEYKQIKVTGTLINGQITNGVLSLDSNAANGTVSVTTSHWEGNTLYASPGNGFVGVSGTDIKSVNFTNDANYLYWSMQLYETPNTNLSTNTDAGYTVSIVLANGTDISNRVSYIAGAWKSRITVNKSYWDPSYDYNTSAINGRIPISLLGSGDITIFPSVGAYVYDGTIGSMGIGN